jgi:hypothetical protein
VHAAVRLLPALAAVAAGTSLTACGGAGGQDARCGDHSCTIEASGPVRFELDELTTNVAISELRADSVRVKINADSAVVRRGTQARLRGFLVTATETATDHAKVTIER